MPKYDQNTTQKYKFEVEDKERDIDINPNLDYFEKIPKDKFFY